MHNDEQNEWDQGWIDTGLVFTVEDGAALDPDATVSITPDACSHAIPAMQEEAAVLIAGLVFAAK
jgi:hypothetical protein